MDFDIESAILVSTSNKINGIKIKGVSSASIDLYAGRALGFRARHP